MTIPETPRRRAGRPRAFDPDAAITAAMDTFWLRGYTVASMAELTAATGLSTSSLYAAFGSKEQLFEAALDRYLTEVIDGFMIGPMTHGDAGLADVRAFLDRLEATIATTPARGCLAINTMIDVRQPSAAIAARTTGYRDRLAQGLLAAFTRAEAASEIPAGHAAERAATIAPIVIAFNMLLTAGAPAAAARGLLDTARAVAGP